ncbi:MULTISPECIES: precorrin-8X methylmutase [Arthrospira]|uniref:Precorrin isomerase n=1 Tax=Limnospira platensis NIES-46 TaxID=1236695 RepID=A0A5M3T6A7_LIMPL|nr:MULTISPECIES: precorrin-8X methylmutase [Arthrospira]AMW28817.1 precorrin isomerase [Arthrospira platensis YZ]MBD2668314.1 precorrin-8X methylmutase [Arthrospira platensis FACHB-439]MBD2709508.1 precorrin-8X methylmutase [Arthrospira platensis FACHB-835]MDF2210309.1 precorrin-8X methylmutase [Arthrospira platensis NCB002]MDT9181816.1 precorrin-8X methylmutase [Limnospira sp. PMC 289.06]MDT9293989.1 precorrin-8X methylmutase [Arthrospira platensis PCC 7345]QQW31586.1 precorrin-8X methylmut
MIDYLRDGNQIYQKSFGIIRDETDFKGLSDDLSHVAVRLIHACGMTDIVGDLNASEDAVKAGREALQEGKPIFCDAMMVARGITKKRLPKNNPIICTLNHPDVPDIARQINNTRSAAALELWGDNLQGAVVAIGNAPTALFHLLEMLDDGLVKPALILGFPVGFVGAAESKLELASNSRGIPFMTLHGRRGGSAIAAAAVNALAKENEL